MWKKWLIVAMILLSVLGGWYLISKNKSRTPVYQTSTVKKGDLVSSISVSGQVVTTGRLPVLSQASGEVKTVFVKNGDSVLAGQKILSIVLDPVAAQKNAAAWSSYLAANAAFYSTQSTMLAKWKTYYDLATNDTYQNSDKSPNDPNRSAAAFHIAQDDWLKAEADYKNQQAVVTAAWLNYQQTASDLVAPISGNVTDLTYVQGMLINSAVNSGITQSQTIASIVTDSLPTITVNLSEIDVNRVMEDSRATLTFDALPGKVFVGRVVGINRTGVVTSGVTNYPATIQLDANVPQILPNMSATATIIISQKSDVLLIPSEAVQIQNGKQTVRVIRNSRPQTVSVEIGLNSDTQTEIVSGLSEGDSVVTGVNNKATSTSTGQSPFSTFRFGGNTGAGARTTGR